MQKLKILISAYACAPNTGSEPGVGWNFIYGLSNFHEVHVITEQKKFKKLITDFLKANPEKSEILKFYFIPKKRNKKLRKLWPPSYYWFYRDWQKKAYQLALELNQKENFDLIHQLTMVGYREPGYLWQINKPFVWGPIGGLENSPWKFLPSLGFKGMLFYAGRNILNWYQRNFYSRPKKAATRNKTALISATIDNHNYIKKLWKKTSYITSEIGTKTTATASLNIRKPEEPLSIIWSGLHIPRKNLSLLLASLSTLKTPYKLHVLGEGEMTVKWQQLAIKHGIASNCIWHGWLEQHKALEIMGKGHVLCITSVSDLTSTITLEGLSLGLPIICLNHCGFSHVVTDNCGIAIPVDSPKKAAINFKNALEQLYTNENKRQQLSLGAIQRSKEFNWGNKITEMNSIYNTLLNEL